MELIGHLVGPLYIGQKLLQKKKCLGNILVFLYIDYAV